MVLGQVPKPPARIGWVEEQRRINAFLSKSSTNSKRTKADVNSRFLSNRRKKKAVESVLRWRARNPKTYARYMRRYMKKWRALRKTANAMEAASIQSLQAVSQLTCAPDPFPA